MRKYDSPEILRKPVAETDAFQPDSVVLVHLGSGTIDLTGAKPPQSDLDPANLEFINKSPDHFAVTVETEDGPKSYIGAETHGTGLIRRGQIILPKGGNNDIEAADAAVEAVLDEFETRGIEKTYTIANGPEEVASHINRGATIKEGKNSYVYNVPEALDFIAAKEREVVLPEGYSIGFLDTYDEDAAAGLTKLMPILTARFGPELDPEKVANYEYMINSSNYEVLVVRDHNKEVVGGLSLSVAEKVTENGSVWQLEDVAVSPEHKGNGIASYMVKYFLERAQEVGVDTVTLQTEVDKAVANQLYTNTGANLQESAVVMQYLRGKEAEAAERAKTEASV